MVVNNTAATATRIAVEAAGRRGDAKRLETNTDRHATGAHRAPVGPIDRATTRVRRRPAAAGVSSPRPGPAWAHARVRTCTANDW